MESKYMMCNIQTNRDIINRILHVMSLEDLVKMRRLSREYKAFVDTHCADKFTIMKFEPIPTTYFTENFKSDEFNEKVKEFLIFGAKIVIEDKEKSKKKKMHNAYHLYIYMIQNLSNVFASERYTKLLNMMIWKIEHELVADIYKYDTMRRLCANFSCIYREICIHDPMDYILYFKTSVKNIFVHLDPDDILNLRLAKKRFAEIHRDRLTIAYTYLNRSIDIQDPIRYSKTRKIPINLDDPYKSILALVSKINCPARYILCNRLADHLSKCIQYFNYIDEEILKHIYRELESMINKGFVATKKLRIISTEFMHHIFVAKLDI